MLRLNVKIRIKNAINLKNSSIHALLANFAKFSKIYPFAIKRKIFGKSGSFCTIRRQNQTIRSQGLLVRYLHSKSYIPAQLSNEEAKKIKKALTL